MAHRILIAHGLAVKVLRREVADCKIGYAPCFDPAIPHTDRDEDIEAARKAYFGFGPHGLWALSCSWWSDPVVLGKYPEEMLPTLEKYLPEHYQEDMEIICQPLDFYGQNIYKGFRYRQGKDGVEEVEFPTGYPYTAIGWPVTPECLYWAAKFLYERYHLPFLVAENGISCRDIISLDGKVHDANRIDYMHKHLLQLRKAIEEGVDVCGYFAWSFMDNFEWASGYNERFGLVYVDYQTLERTPKDSYDWYKQTIETNGESLQKA